MVFITIRHRVLFRLSQTTNPGCSTTNEPFSLPLPKMSVKQFLLAALACAVMAQNEETPIACSRPFDVQCCKNKGTAACSFELAGITLSGNCLPVDGVSFSPTTYARGLCILYDTMEWYGQSESCYQSLFNFEVILLRLTSTATDMACSVDMQVLPALCGAGRCTSVTKGLPCFYQDKSTKTFKPGICDIAPAMVRLPRDRLPQWPNMLSDP
jgi:hypothetical protein